MENGCINAICLKHIHAIMTFPGDVVNHNPLQNVEGFLFTLKLKTMSILKFKTKSSMVSGDVEYDTGKEQLFVTFKNGSRYRYDNVPLSLYNAFKAHESTGKAIKELLSDCPYQKVS